MKRQEFKAILSDPAGEVISVITTFAHNSAVRKPNGKYAKSGSLKNPRIAGKYRRGLIFIDASGTAPADA